MKYREFKAMDYDDQCRLIFCCVARGIHVDDIAKTIDKSVGYVMRRYRHAATLPPPIEIKILPVKLLGFPVES